MESVLSVAVLALLIAVGVPLWVRLALGRDAMPLYVREVAENRGILPEEWRFVYARHCLPSGCPRLAGDPPKCPRSVECEVCAALFLERHWQRLAGRGRPRTRPLARLWVAGSLALGGAGAILLCCSRLVDAACGLIAGSAALLITRIAVRARRRAAEYGSVGVWGYRGTTLPDSR